MTEHVSRGNIRSGKVSSVNHLLIEKLQNYSFENDRSMSNPSSLYSLHLRQPWLPAQNPKTLQSFLISWMLSKDLIHCHVHVFPPVRQHIRVLDWHIVIQNVIHQRSYSKLRKNLSLLASFKSSILDIFQLIQLTHTYYNDLEKRFQRPSVA